MLEDQPNKVARSTKEKARLPLEQEWEEFDDYDLTDTWPVDQPWLEIDSSSWESFQEDQMAEFSPEQELLFQRRFEEKYDLPDPVYQQWLRINYLTAAQVQENKVLEFSPEQELLFQKRFEENYDLPDPVYQQWLKINYPTAEVQNELQGLPNEFINSYNEVVGDQENALKKQSDKPDLRTSVAVNQEGQVACSTQFDVSPEQEQLFQRTYEDPCFMQWLKRRFPKEHAGMMADHDLGLEHSANVTPCIIVNDNRSLSSENELTSCQESSQSNSSVIQGVTPPEHDGELNYISKYLIQYVPTKKTVNTGKRATGA